VDSEIIASSEGKSFGSYEGIWQQEAGVNNDYV
jgi:hypothetical protein